MAVTITMPKLGLTMNSGSVQEWKKQIGDTVKKGEPLFSVATDKLSVDVESPADGVLLAIAVETGVEVEIGAVLGAIGEAGETVDMGSSGAESAVAQEPVSSQAAPATVPDVPQSSATTPKTGHVPSSPKAKKLAIERGIDIRTLTGTGPMGWVVAKDVPASSSAKASPVAARMAKDAGIDLAAIATDGSRIMKADVSAVMNASGTGQVLSGGERRVPMTQMRRIIGERMLASTTSIPSVCYFADVDMTALNELRARINARTAKKEGSAKVSVNDILMKFCAKLLIECPLLNGSVEQDAFVLHDYVNIGFAVALPGGLMVPNVKNVHLKGLAEIAAERAELVAGTRGGGLSPDALAGGTFTISNLGMMGVDYFTPIINPPEVAILGVGTTTEKPVVRNGQIVARPVATLSLTADHRLADGADAAEFLSKLKDLVEDPGLFLL